MRAPAERDETTLTIASAMALSLIVLAVAGLVIWAVHLAIGLSEDMAEALAVAALVLSAVVLIAHLARHGRAR